MENKMFTISIEDKNSDYGKREKFELQTDISVVNQPLV